MLRKTALLFLTALILCGGLTFAQYNRDEVINITFPLAGTVVDTDTVVVTFDLAPFFDIGDSACVDCDGYLKAYLNGMVAGAGHQPDSFVLTDLVDGLYSLLVEAVDPNGNPFTPTVFDTASFQVAYEENFCPPELHAVESQYEFEVLTVFWAPPLGGGGTSMNSWDFEMNDGGFIPTADWDPVGDWEWTDSYDVSLYGATGGTYYPPPLANSGTGLWGTVVHDNHTGAGGRSFMRKTVNLAGYNDVEISFWSWLDVWGSWDYCELYVNGTLVWDYILSTVPTEWVLNTVDLSAWAGESEVELSFEYYATTVVNHAGWYLDDIAIGVPAPVTVSQRTGREIIPTCGDLTGYKIYRDNVFLADVDTTFYRDSVVTLGTEYCYFIQAVYDDDGSPVNSVNTDTLCGTPETYVPAPITNLSSFPMDEEVYLSWTPPGTPTFLFFEDFSNGIPASWTVIDGGDGSATWISPHDNSNTVFSGFGDELYAICDSDDAPSTETLDELLVTPVIVLTGYATPFLQFTTYYNDISITDSLEYAAIDVSIDGGTNWTNVLFWNEDHGTAAAPELAGVDISAIAGNQESVTIRFHYADNNHWAWYWAIDNITILDGPPLSRTAEGDFTQYNVYQDDTLIDSTEFSNYIATGLTNGQLYTFGITAEYYPDYESASVEVDQTPIWLYGDVTGVITDPAGNLLDSAIVKAGALVDTTGVDGVYFLKNLNPGVHAVSVSRAGFDGSLEDATIIAQEAATVLDFMMIPKLGKPRGLVAYGGNLEVDLAWHSPGGLDEFELFYDDGTWEGSITGGASDIEVAVKFTPGSPGNLVGGRFVFSSVGQVGYTLDPVEVRVYSVGTDGMPDQPLYIADSYTTVPMEDDWVEVDLSGADINFDETGFFLGYRFTLDGGPGTARDMDNYIYGHSYVLVGGAWSETGDLGFPGNYIIRALAGLDEAPRTGDVQELVATAEISEAFRKSTPALIDSRPLLDPVYNITGDRVQVFRNSARTDSLTGYNVYQIRTIGDTLVANTTADDSSATIVVPTNYSDYCFNVKAIWNTDSYGVLESKPSNVACAVPFLPGDVDFIDGVTIIDLLMVVDFALEVTTPSADQLRGADLNRDGMINIQDIIMIVDIIIPPTTARISSDAATEAIIELVFDGQQNLTALLDYNGIVRGSQFTIRYDATNLELSSPRLSASAEGMVVNYNESEPGILNIVIADLSGGSISYANGKLMTIPVSFKGNNRLSTIVALDESILVGANGESIPVLTKSASLDVRALPTQYALHQNYPNPFNPDTEIMFDLPEAGQVELVIYNLMGQKVATLVSNEMVGGYHKIRWNGLSDNGSAVATGMYFYQISSPNFHATRKMVLLK